MIKCFGDIGRFVPVLNGISTCVACCEAMGSNNPEVDGAEMLDALEREFDGADNIIRTCIPGDKESADWYEENIWKLYQYLKKEWGFPAGQDFIFEF